MLAFFLGVHPVDIRAYAIACCSRCPSTISTRVILMSSLLSMVSRRLSRCPMALQRAFFLSSVTAVSRVRILVGLLFCVIMQDFFEKNSNYVASLAQAYVVFVHSVGITLHGYDQQDEAACGSLVQNY